MAAVCASISNVWRNMVGIPTRPAHFISTTIFYVIFESSTRGKPNIGKLGLEAMQRESLLVAGVLSHS
jgi:hypothetical protein